MDEITLDQKAEAICEASEKISDTRLKNRTRDQYKGTFGDAIVQEVITDEDVLDDTEHIKFKLLMPDMETVRYISFTKEGVSKNAFEEFLTQLETTPSEMNVLYRTVPVVYTVDGWKISYSTDFISSAVRDGKYCTVDKTGQFWYTRWFYLGTAAVVLPLSLLSYAFGLGFEPILLLIWVSILFQPIFLSAYGMSGLYTGLHNLSEE